jgi:hypothetical protein
MLKNQKLVLIYPKNGLNTNQGNELDHGLS